MNLKDIKEKDMIWWIEGKELCYGVVEKVTKHFYILDSMHTSWGYNRKHKDLVFTNRHECLMKMLKDTKYALNVIKQRLIKIKELEFFDFNYHLKNY